MLTFKEMYLNESTDELNEATKAEQNVIEILTEVGISEEDARKFYLNLTKDSDGWSMKSARSSYIYLKKTIKKTSVVSKEQHERGMRESSGLALLKALLDKYKIKYSINYSSGLSGVGNSGYYKVERTANIILQK